MTDSASQAASDNRIEKIPEKTTNPVHQHNKLWYFWDETWSYRQGPYATEIEAREVFKEYCEKVLLPLKKPEAVNHPAHYGGGENVYEHIKVCRAWNLNYELGNATKYICRAGKKTANPIEDLQKAAWYLNAEIERLKAASTAQVSSK